MLEDHQVSPHDRLGTMFCKRCSQEHHRKLMQKQDLFPVIHGNDYEHCWRCSFPTGQFFHSKSGYSFYRQLALKKEFYISLKISERLVKSDSLEDISSTLISSSINSSFERYSSWLLVQTIIIYEYTWYKIKIKLN